MTKQQIQSWPTPSMHSTFENKRTELSSSNLINNECTTRKFKTEFSHSSSVNKPDLIQFPLLEHLKIPGTNMLITYNNNE